MPEYGIYVSYTFDSSVFLFLYAELSWYHC